MSGRLTIVRPELSLPHAQSLDETLVGFDDFRAWVRTGRILTHLGRHGEGRLLVHRLEAAGRPLPLGLALRTLCRGPLYVEDLSGRRRRLTNGQLARWIRQLAMEPLQVPTLLKRVERTVERLEESARQPKQLSLNLGASPLYLRTDLSFNVRAGGSVGHIAGVVNALQAFTGPEIVLTTADLPTVHPTIELHRVDPGEAFWNFKELPTFLLNDAFERSAADVIGERRLAFVYQRYSLNSYAGLAIARRNHVPFVLEYNGSEIWMSQHWGRRLKYERLAARIELLDLAAADLVVVVSRAMADEIARRGVEGRKVLVNPNGVDPDRYHPGVDGSTVRARYDLEGSTVIGFIGTFGPWHGAEVLAHAFVRLLSRDRESGSSLRLLMIGDGSTLASVRRILSDGGALEATRFTGLVPQEAGPQHLAACDVLVCPHVPNPDGSPFFGSPTKLFEYMAMGRGIVASNLDQIGEVLEHAQTAWLVPPADVEALAAGLHHLLVHANVRSSLGSNARTRALERYTWREHTRRTVERLREVVIDPVRAQPASCA